MFSSRDRPNRYSSQTRLRSLSTAALWLSIALAAAHSAAAVPPALPPAAAVHVAVDPNADRHPVSPWIFGVNFGSAAQAQRLHWPIRRWGGNATTRYSWQDDIANRASDYFFFNIEEDNPNPGQLPNGSAADRFVDDTRAGGGEALLTVPTIGWTPIDRTRRWAFSVQKYGPQQLTECTYTGNAPFCVADMGNGVRPNGSLVTGNDPHDTSREIGPDFVTGWMAHLATRTGTAAQGGVRLFNLDNEPMLWNSSHRDVHPNPTTYDELWQRTRDYAAAIKARDAGARILGPSDWGWCAYFYSAADGCSAGADAQAHGGVPLIPWYLDQVRAYQTAHGVRLIDYLDVHYYPQADGVALGNDESAATSARRLRSLKGLYDPSYVDESWIGQPVRLIPRLREWIAGHLPGTLIALTEYNWGDGGTSSALAQAEALAIFGREQVDLAARWVAPAEQSLIEDAFRLYLDYDGHGAKVQGDSVRATSGDVDAVGSYAVRNGSRLYLLLFNKDTVTRTVNADVVGGLANNTLSLFRFDGAHRLAAAGTATVAAGAVSLDLPGRSATLAVADLPVVASPGTDFYTVTPCRLVDTRSTNAPALAAGEARTFALAGKCGIPSTADALALNLTAVTPGSAGNFGAYPGGTVAPVASVLGFVPGRNRAGNAVLKLSGDGTGSLTVKAVMPTGTVHLILDVVGYFQ